MKFKFIKNEYRGLKKYKVINFLFFKLKFRVNNRKNIKRYVLENKPQPLFISRAIVPLQKVYLSVVAVYKDEPDIIEWIEYHKLVGVERFYLYDNGSTDNSKELLQPYIEDGTVIYTYNPGKCVSFAAYKDAIYRSKDETTWLAMIDLDEYICPVTQNTIPEILKDFEQYPALGINWIMFDSNGYENRPNIPIIEAYTRVIKDYQYGDNKHIKTIFKPKEVNLFGLSHFCYYKNHKLAVNEQFDNIGSLYSYTSQENAFTLYNSVSKIRINHYYTKSLEDAVNKERRGYPDIDSKREISMGSVVFEAETTHDYVIQKYLPELKKRMNLRECI